MLMFEAEYKVVHVEAIYSSVKVVLREEVEEKTPMLEAIGSSGEKILLPSGLVTPTPIPVEMPLSEPDPEKVKKAMEKIRPLNETDEEKIVRRFMDAYEKAIPGFSFKNIMEERAKDRKRPIGLIVSKSPSLLTLQLSREQYEAMGSPAFDQVITLRIDAHESSSS